MTSCHNQDKVNTPFSSCDTFKIKFSMIIKNLKCARDLHFLDKRDCVIWLPLLSKGHNYSSHNFHKLCVIMKQVPQLRITLTMRWDRSPQTNDLGKGTQEGLAGSWARAVEICLLVEILSFVALWSRGPLPTFAVTHWEFKLN